MTQHHALPPFSCYCCCLTRFLPHISLNLSPVHIPFSTFSHSIPSFLLSVYNHFETIREFLWLLGSSCQTVDRISVFVFSWMMKIDFSEAKLASSSQSFFYEVFDLPELLHLFQRHLVVLLDLCLGKGSETSRGGEEGVVGHEPEGCRTWRCCLLLKNAEDGAPRGHCCDLSREAPLLGKWPCFICFV